MIFCEKEDLKTGIRGEELDAITRTEEIICTDAISTAISEAKGYLGAYDTETMFSKKGDERDRLLLSFIRAMAIYEILAVSPLNQDIEDRRLRAKRATDYLMGVHKGELTPDWRKRERTRGAVGSYGSNPRRRHHY